MIRNFHGADTSENMKKDTPQRSYGSSVAPGVAGSLPPKVTNKYTKRRLPIAMRAKTADIVTRPTQSQAV